jgi:U3 small nucleolar RNA-associated protein 22
MISSRISSKKRLAKDVESRSGRKIHVSQKLINGKQSRHPSHDEEEWSTESEYFDTDDGSDLQKKQDAKTTAAIQDEKVVENIRKFKETEALYKSTVFRLQMEEMLKEIRVPYSSLKGLEHALKQLKSIIDTIEEVNELSWLQAMKHIESEALGSDGKATPSSTCKERICPGNRIHIPWILETLKETGPLHCKFSFRKPHTMTIVGSYLLRTCTKPILNVDIAIEIPSNVFQQKDYLNHYYFYKRAFYLVKIATALQQSNLFGCLSYQCFHGDRRRPILLVRSITTTNNDAGKETSLDELAFDKSHFVIRIIPCINKETFKLSKLSPARQNLRDSYGLATILTIDKGAQQENDEKKEQISDVVTRWPTPFYNNTILSEMFHKEHLTLVHEALLQCPSAIDAILLLKTWLRQRSFNAMSGAFDGFLITMLVAYLTRQQKIVKHLSSYQIFRVVLQFIVQHDWFNVPLSFSNVSSTSNSKAKTEKEEEKNREFYFQDMTVYRALFSIVFLDADGKLNLCANVSKTAMLEMQYEADLSIRMLNDASRDCFADLFLKPFDKHVRFDIMCQVHLGHVEEAVATFMKENSSEDVEHQIVAGLSRRLMDFGSISICFIHWISNLLKEALQDRIRWIHLEIMEEESHDDDKTTNPHRKNNIEQEPIFPMASGASQACKLLVGLCLNPEHAFRSVDHGPSVNDTMAAEAFRKLWGDKAELRRFQDGSIRETIVWNHHSLSKNKLSIYHEMLGLVLKRHFMIIPKKHILWPFSLYSTLSSHEEMSSMSFANMNKAFYEFSKELRRLEELPLTITSVQPARYYTSSGVLFNDMYFLKQPFEMVIHFESTTQWPDDIDAIRALKAAFYLHLAERLQRTYEGVLAIPTFQYLDVSHSRYHMAFRIRIVHEREIYLLHEKEKRMKNTGEQLEKDLIHRPRLVSRLQSLAAQYPAFNSTLQLARDWFNGHFFSSYVPIEVVDLLVAHLFLNPYPYTEPVSDIAGFCRFIQLLATHNWQTAPLILNFNQTLTTDDFTQILERFIKSRELMTQHRSRMYIATSDDLESRHWTLDMPNKPFLSRLVHYAQKTFETIQNHASQEISLDARALCVTPLDGYDILIHLNAIEEASLLPSAVGFDPMHHFVHELRHIFGEYALFLYNPRNISVIAVLWKPIIKYDRPLKVKHNFMSRPSFHGEDVRVDCANIVHTIEILGQDLIREIVILKEFDS